MSMMDALVADPALRGEARLVFTKRTVCHRPKSGSRKRWHFDAMTWDCEGRSGFEEKQLEPCEDSKSCRELRKLEPLREANLSKRAKKRLAKSGPS